jgi:hypothetical protein
VFSLSASPTASAVTRNTTSADAGGILNRAGTAVLNASRVSGNTSEDGAGIASGPGNPDSPVTASSLTLNGSRVDHNTATSAVGGIVNGGLAVIRGSLVDHNSAPVGGGIGNHGTTTITGSQITGNTAPTDSAGTPGMGGGIINANFGIPPTGGSGVLTIKGSKITGNSASGSGGGILNQDGTVTLKGTLVAGNTPDNCEPPGTIAGCTD